MESMDNEAAIASHLNISSTYVSNGNLEAALQHLHQALRLNPHHAGAYNNLGRILYQQRQFTEAIFYFKKALRINPNHWEAHYNLAHSFVQQNQIEYAITHYQEVIKIVPEHLNAHFNVALLYVEMENYPFAEIHFNQVLALDLENLEATKRLGQIYLQLGQTAKSMAMYKKALNLDSTFIEAHHNLAILYLREKESIKALNHFELAFELDKSNETAKHMIQALKNNKNESESVTAAPRSYVTQLFDQYADHYNQHLKTELKYQAPFLLRSAVGRCLKNNPKAMRVLDLGCGTGLGGIMFRDLALELVGVDLSAKMLEKANALDTYEALLQKDIQEYLSDSTLNPFDLIFASDVFVYMGSLQALFGLIAQKMVKNGFFAFTIETTTNSHFQLQTTGRFAHSAAYIKKLASDNELPILIQEDITLREQNGVPLPGQLYVLTSL